MRDATRWTRLLVVVAMVSWLGGCAGAGAGDASDDGSKINWIAGHEEISEDMPSEELGTTSEALSAEFEKYAVGVVLLDPASCPADRLVTIYTDDSDYHNESDYTGWDTPDTARRARRHDTGYRGTTWQFCKVDGRNFKSLTKFASKTHYFYATLRLGDHCPNGSKLVAREMADENIDGDNDSRMTGPKGWMNYSYNGFITHMDFCVFKASTDKMTSFPDLGMQYAVFHDYDGAQPDLFFKKRWVYSDNNDGATHITRTWSSSDADEDAFGLMISGDGNTMFDLGQVQ